MKLPASDKTSTYGKKPYIKKGYYPAKLISVEPFKNSDGTMKEGKYGRQIIFEFAIFKSDEAGAPTEPIYTQDGEDPKLMTNVIIPKFVYHEYKNKKTNEFQTAITPNSAITKILKALGWVFSVEGVDIDKLIGNWVEANIDDYEHEVDGDTYTASSIKDINPYKGPKVSKDFKEVRKTTSENVVKQVKHEAIKEVPISSEKQESEEVQKLKSKIEELKNLNKEGFLTNEGLNQAIEQLETKIEELNKK